MRDDCVSSNLKLIILLTASQNLLDPRYCVTVSTVAFLSAKRS